MNRSLPPVPTTPKNNVAPTANTKARGLLSPAPYRRSPNQAAVHTTEANSSAGRPRRMITGGATRRVISCAGSRVISGADSFPYGDPRRRLGCPVAYRCSGFYRRTWHTRWETG